MRSTRLSISLQETGFQLQSMDQAAEAGRFFEWQEITTITAYKRDCFAYDLTCLAIGDASSAAVEINEQDIGWDTFIRAVSQKLPGSVPVDIWWPAVAQPPFATNQTTIYRKGPPSG